MYTLKGNNVTKIYIFPSLANLSAFLAKRQLRECVKTIKLSSYDNVLDITLYLS